MRSEAVDTSKDIFRVSLGPIKKDGDISCIQIGQSFGDASVRVKRARLVDQSISRARR